MNENWFEELINKTGIKVITVLIYFMGTEETLGAFYLTTLILIILPIAMVVGVVLWLYKKKLSSLNHSG